MSANKYRITFNQQDFDAYITAFWKLLMHYSRIAIKRSHRDDFTQFAILNFLQTGTFSFHRLRANYYRATFGRYKIHREAQFIPIHNLKLIAESTLIEPEFKPKHKPLTIQPFQFTKTQLDELANRIESESRTKIYHRYTKEKDRSSPYYKRLAARKKQKAN